MPSQDAAKRIRRGGIATPDGYRYELSGGALCLDLANTVDSRPTPEPRELIPDVEHLVQWSEQAGVVPHGTAERLRREAERHPRRASRLLYRAHTLREAIFDLFSASVAGRAGPKRALRVLNQHVFDAFSRGRLAVDGTGYGWQWVDEVALGGLLRPVARSAVELLISDRLDRVRQCAARDCDWLFLDESRNRSRRWCDMAVCGNRAKARGFRRRGAPARRQLLRTSDDD